MEFLNIAKARVKTLEDPMVNYKNQSLIKEELDHIFQKMRKQAGLSQAELAKRLGVTPPAISRLEKNQLTPASKR
ncbi:TPA: helix-turn-helix domain-containing protein [Serratia fonticola]|uniref:Plasmid maintenance system antidote protein n=1 Tax=Serratia fonticola TaxID=47917 RepID=A0A3S4X3M3_SERFO|nr:helix-turn-helix transcriptional regulator [Serratia fonticola]CAI2527880.1 Plasmid maintenance system antidote protein [Serratia fonticola]VEI64778.1 Plasmid maintenance system antidote protein [Serratia fonticola]